nr:hypothetical protein [Tanacetum cinerariifolium]
MKIEVAITVSMDMGSQLHCQPIDQNVDFSGSDQIQIPQYPDVHPPSQEKSEEVSQARKDLVKSIQTFLEKFNCIPFEERPQILSQAWFKFFAIQYSKPEDPNELFQKLLKDLKELAEYNNSPSRDRSTFLNDEENNSVQNKESLENSSNEIAASNFNQEKEDLPQDSDIQLLCMHDNGEDLIESALNSKLLSINSNSQHLDKKEQEVKNVVEQPAERGTRVEKSLQDFRVIHKNESECDVPAKDDCSPTFTTFSNPLFNNNDDLDSSDSKSLPEEDVPAEEFKVYSNPLFNKMKSILIKITESGFDFEEEIHLSENLLHDNSSSQPPGEHNAEEERIKKEHVDYISRMEMLFTINPRPRPTMNANTIIESLSSLPIPVQDGDSQREDIDIVTDTDDVLSPSVENDDDSEGEIDVVEELL